MDGSALGLVSVVLATAGAILGVVAGNGHRHRRGMGTVIVHLAPAVAMVTMVTTTTGSGAVPYLVAAILLALMLALALARVARPTGRRARILTGRAIADLAATAMLLVLLAASHRPGDIRGGMAMSHAASLPLSVLIALVLVGWMAIVAWCTVAAWRTAPARRSVVMTSSGAGLMAAGMTVMAGMAIA